VALVGCCGCDGLVLWLVGVDVMGWFFGRLGGFEKILLTV
jgi:hypothetical protein